MNNTSINKLSAEHHFTRRSRKVGVIYLHLSQRRVSGKVSRDGGRNAASRHNIYLWLFLLLLLLLAPSLLACRPFAHTLDLSDGYLAGVLLNSTQLASQ